MARMGPAAVAAVVVMCKLRVVSDVGVWQLPRYHPTACMGSFGYDTVVLGRADGQQLLFGTGGTLDRVRSRVYNPDTRRRLGRDCCVSQRLALRTTFECS